MVTRGLDPDVQRAMDVVRVVGNNAVHPGEIALGDDVDVVAALFDMLNVVVEQLITQSRKIWEMYSHLPQGARDAIARRDGPDG